MEKKTSWVATQLSSCFTLAFMLSKPLYVSAWEISRGSFELALDRGYEPLRFMSTLASYMGHTAIG